MHPYVMYFLGISIFNSLALHLSDSIAVAAHYWLYPIRLSLLMLLLF